MEEQLAKLRREKIYLDNKMFEGGFSTYPLLAFRTQNPQSLPNISKLIVLFGQLFP